MDTLDAVVIGAGHNGLTAAAYLARAGLTVQVVERRPIIGGAAATVEFHPGFRNSVAAYTVSLLQPKVIRDLDLAGHGLTIVERRAQNFLPLPDERYLLAGEGRTAAEIAKFSSADADRYSEYSAMVERVADVLRDLVLEAPPTLLAGGLRQALPELLKLATLGRRFWRLDQATRRALVDLFTGSAGHVLDGWFDSDPIKALLGFDAVVGNLASPYSQGSAYVLLHHCFGEVNGRKGVWGHALGGMGAISAAIAAAARAHGATIETGAGVREIIVERDRACGVVLDDGRTLRARSVLCNADPTSLFERLLPAGAVPAEVTRRMRQWQSGSGTLRMNVALSALPQFSALPGTGIGDHHTAGIIIAPSLAYMDRAYLDCRTTGWSREPIVEMLIPSTLDDSLAPPGAHVASLFCQHVMPQLPDGSSWDDHRDTVADLMIETVDRCAPGFKASVVGRQILTPLDLMRDFNLPNGDIFHGALSLDQLWANRPMLGHADTRMPVPGLYLCGAGVHPGGGVTGAPGHNAAMAVLADRGRRR